jgi:hypothetical protein
MASRFQRIVKRFASRSLDYEALRLTDSPAAAAAWAQRAPLDMFNKNVLRAKVVQGLAEAMPATGFYEMGTYHAATAVGAQRYLGLPVWSCEVNPRNYFISQLVTFNLPHITLVKADSRHFLRQVVADLKPAAGARPFFYLDAHENELDLDSLPLAEELDLLFALDEFVILVDDFQVPEAAGFKAGTFGGVVVEVNLIRAQLLANGITTCYFPAYPAGEDTGYPSGYCVFWRSARLDAALRAPAFPLTLLRPYGVAAQAYLENAPVS